MSKSLIIVVLLLPTIIFAQLDDDSKGAIRRLSPSSSGYTVGVQTGYPIFLSSALDRDPNGTGLWGIVVSTPHGFNLGPSRVRLESELTFHNFNGYGTNGDGTSLTDFYGLGAGALLSSIVAETAFGPVSAECGVGWYATTAGLSSGVKLTRRVANSLFDFDMFFRYYFMFDTGQDQKGNTSASWLNFGLNLSYSLRK